MEQPQAILRDSAKAIEMYNDPNRVPDRFGDDVDQMAFWIHMTKILRAELVKALGVAENGG